MKKNLCPNGHYYDADRFSSCPLCEPSPGEPQPNGNNGEESLPSKNVPAMIMCKNGHVFDPSVTTTCPICGAGAEEAMPPAPVQSVNKVTCLNGHLFDRNKHTVCPICGAIPQEEKPHLTEPSGPEQAEVFRPSSPFIPDNEKFSEISQGNVQNDSLSIQKESNETQKALPTVPVIDSDEDILNDATPLEIETLPVSPVAAPVDPMSSRTSLGKLPVAWLMGVKGPYRGTLFPCRTGRNRMGISSAGEIDLSDDPAIEDDIQAFLIYEPRQRQYFLQARTGNSLVYHNGEMVFSHTPLAPYDRIQLGNTELVFVPLCGEKFTWEEG